MRRPCWLLLLLSANGLAGEIPGIPSPLPPAIDRRVEFNLSNDFLGRGGSTDDFRTQQMILTAAIGDRWIASIDHSILTRRSPVIARIDQMSATLGYRLFSADTQSVNQRIVIGGGIRSVGDFDGDRIQNGFHRLVGSDVVLRPYTDTRETHVTVWADAEHYSLFGEVGDEWRFGYWLRGSAMLTSGGEFDAAAGAYAVATRDTFDAWLGLRRDWRTGYEGDPVLVDTASEEDDLALAVGVRWGPLVLETVQQFNNASSYGQFRMVSGGGDGSFDNSILRFGLEAGLLMPDVHVQLAARHTPGFLDRPGSASRRSLVLALMYGEPQLEQDPTLYRVSSQVALGIEWEAAIPGAEDRATIYGSIGAGYREERLDGDRFREGQRSNSVGSAVLSLAIGTRIDTARIGRDWRYRLQFGLNGWIPLDDATFAIEDETFPALGAAAAFVVAVNFDRS